MKIESFVVGRRNADAFTPLLTEEFRERLEDPDLCLIGASAERRAVGAAILSVDEETTHSAQLLYLAVAEKYRREGVGTELLNRCLRVSRQFAVDRLECALIGGEDTEKTEEDALAALLTAWGMEQDEGEQGVCGSFFLKDLKKNGILFRAFGDDKKSMLKFKQEETGNCFCLGDTKRSLLTDCDMEEMAPCGFEGMDKELSFVYVKDGAIEADFLVGKRGENFCVEWMTMGPHHRIDALIFLMDFSMNAALKKYPEETKIIYSAWNDRAKALIDRILGENRTEREIRFFSLSDAAFRLRAV